MTKMTQLFKHLLPIRPQSIFSKNMNAVTTTTSKWCRLWGGHHYDNHPRRTCVTSSGQEKQRRSIRSILDSVGSSTARGLVVVRGWVKSTRRHRNRLFLHVNDGSCPRNIQVVMEGGDLPPHPPHYGSAVEVRGRVVESPARLQTHELKAEELTVIGDCSPLTYPFDGGSSQHPIHYARQYPHLRSRTDFFNAVLRARSKVTMHVHKFFQERGYVHIDTPIISSGDCEGAGQLFNVSAGDGRPDGLAPPGKSTRDFFDAPAYLTVSGQLHLESTIGGFDKVYTFGPAFRAENSQTRHHLSEFYMLEAELAFTENIDDLTAVMQDCLKTLTENFVRDCAEELDTLGRLSTENGDRSATLTKILDNDFVTLSYTEALRILSNNSAMFGGTVPKWGGDLQKEHEKFLVRHCDNVPVFVVDFPQSLKPFYSRRNDGNRPGDPGPTVAAVDMLVPGVGELFGGSLREERLDQLRDNISEFTPEDSGNLDWYFDLRRFGTVPHGGFGMGFERYLQLVLGIGNIRDSIPFPRFPHSCQL